MCTPTSIQHKNAHQVCTECLKCAPKCAPSGDSWHPRSRGFRPNFPVWLTVSARYVYMLGVISNIPSLIINAEIGLLGGYC